MLITGEIYWTDTAEDIIQKATPDGKRIESIIVDGLETADGIVVDSTGRKVLEISHCYFVCWELFSFLGKTINKELLSFSGLHV